MQLFKILFITLFYCLSLSCMEWQMDQSRSTHLNSTSLNGMRMGNANLNQSDNSSITPALNRTVQANPDEKIATEECMVQNEILVIKYTNPEKLIGPINVINFQLFRKEDTALIPLGHLTGVQIGNTTRILTLRITNENERGKKYGTFLVSFAFKKYQNSLKNSSSVTWEASPDNPQQINQLVSFYKRFGGTIVKNNRTWAEMALDPKQLNAKL